MSKNLLIGAITNYIWDDVAPFFNSYKQANFEDCECVMFTGSMSEETQAKIQNCGVDVLPIPEELSGQKIINIRWKLYYDFLKDNYYKYNMVLTADVRDVIFQCDPFRLCDGSKPFLGVALEDGTIAEDPKYDAKWILDAYGNDIYQEIKDDTIICVGTVWGTSAEFMEYSRIMSDILLSEWSLRLNVVEQAAGNYIIYHDKMFADELRPSTNYDGYVMTVGLTDAKNLHADSEGNVLNGRGELAAVVHQYDRKPEIMAMVAGKYSAGMSWIARLRLKYYYHRFGLVLRFLHSMRRKGFLAAVRQTFRYVFRI